MSSVDQQGTRPPWDKGSKTPWIKWLKRPGVWIGGILLLALGAAIQSLLVPWLVDLWHKVTERGDAVEVIATSPEYVSDLWLPLNVHMDRARLDELNSMTPEDQYQWFRSQGGIPFGSRQVEVVLKGTRSEPVRITDIRPVAKCSDLETGAFVRLTPNMGGLPGNSLMMVNVERPDERPTWFDSEAFYKGESQGSEYFFDGRHIEISKSDDESLVIRLDSQKSSCLVNLEMTILENDEYHKQMMLEEGQEILVGPRNFQYFEDQFVGMYLGGASVRRV